MKETKEDVSPDVSVEQGLDGELPVLTTTTERKLMAKIDMRILPFLTILYLLAFLDRVNISNAAIFGLREELNILSGTQFNTALTIFFVPYIIFEIPSNLLLKKLRPHIWLSACMFLFGFASIMQGLVNNYSGLLTTRFFLGLFETGMFPGCFYLMGMWYKRTEAQKRFTFFFSSATLAGAFGGLLASAIGKMHGMNGYKGWRWIFILEGVLTCVVAIAWYFLLPDFPEDVKWLNEEERNFIKAKLAQDVGKAGREESITFKDVVDIIKDSKVLIGGVMYFGLIVPAYGYAYFAPIIINSYGYSPIKTQLYSIPPWAAAYGFAMAIAYLSDRVRHRFAFCIFPICLACVGFGILLNVHDKDRQNLQYAALFLVTMGAYSAMPIIVCWFVTNLSGHKRRAIGTGWQIGFGNIGGIIATYSFLDEDSPEYKPGYSISVSFLALGGVSCIAYLLLLMRRNKKRDVSTVAPPTPEQELEYESMGDLSPSYRYQL